MVPITVRGFPDWYAGAYLDYPFCTWYHGMAVVKMEEIAVSKKRNEAAEIEVVVECTPDVGQSAASGIPRELGIPGCNSEHVLGIRTLVLLI